MSKFQEIYFQKVRKIDPLFPIFVLQGEARAYLAFAEFEKAFNLSEEALVRNPRSTRPWQHVLEPLRGYLLLGAFINNNEITKPIANM
mgnify:CR=1 FL=1